MLSFVDVRQDYHSFSAPYMILKSSLFKSIKGLPAWIGEKMETAGRAIHVKGRLSRSLRLPVHERMISREVVLDGE